MATTPTDDPLANSDRTVGVRGHLGRDILKALKREALLFDQIAILDLDLLDRSLGRVSRLELGWLKDIGIVREGPLLAEMEGTIGKPDQTGFYEEMRALSDAYKRKDVAMYNAASARAYSAAFRQIGINAFPILETRRQLGDVFPSGTAPVLEVVLKSMPIPDDETSWEDIIEFRNDPESMKRLRRLRVWVRKFAKDTTATSLAEMKEEIGVILDEYEEHMKLHRMKVNKGAAETLLTVAGTLAEDIVKLKWGELAKLPFILRERKISLLEAEAKAPNRELAFISMARSRFSK